MHISEFISQYLYKNKLSQRQFAKDCGLSNGYISMLINNANPHTGKPLVPSLTTLIALAKGMKITVDELIAKTDDIDVDITLARNIPKRMNEEKPPVNELSEDERLLLELYRKVSPETQKVLLTMVDTFDSQSDETRQMLLAMIRAALGASGSQA